MPVYNMVCDTCGIQERRLVKKNDACLCPSCEFPMKRAIPTSTSTMTKEMKDARRGVSHPKNLNQQLTKRMNEHHDRYEVEGKIDEHGTIDAKKFGWDKKVKRV